MIARDEMSKVITKEGYTVMNLLDYLMQGGKDPEEIKRVAADDIEFIHTRQDCADFKIAYMMRAFILYKDVFSADFKRTLIEEISSFPYDDCGGHGMCTWTENHRLYINGTEYLAAQEGIEFADGVPIKNHLSHAAYKLSTQLSHIEKYGFAEWGSNNYYPETMGALSNIVQFTKNKVIASAAKDALDKILYDICRRTSYNGGFMFNPACARAYVDNKISAKIGNYLEYQLGMITGERFINLKEKEACFQGLLDSTDAGGRHIYTPPKACVRILNDIKNHKELKQIDKEVFLREGLNIKEYKKEGFYTKHVDLETSARMAFTEGAISDYRLICKNIEYLSKTGYIKGDMLKELAIINKPILYKTGLLKLIKFFVPNVFDAAATEEGRVYTYNTGKYNLSAAFDYHVGKASFQQNSLSVNLSHDISLFVTSPYRVPEKSASPDYWTGNRVNPRAVAYRNVAMAMFENKKSKNKELEMTHLFFPTELFDELDLSRLSEGVLLAHTSGVNVAVYTNPGVEFRNIGESLERDKSILAGKKVKEGTYKKEYDLINRAKDGHYYVFETDDSLSFEEFKARVGGTGVTYEKGRIEYSNKEHEFKLSYKGRFMVDKKEFIPG